MRQILNNIPNKEIYIVYILGRLIKTSLVRSPSVG